MKFLFARVNYFKNLVLKEDKILQQLVGKMGARKKIFKMRQTCAKWVGSLEKDKLKEKKKS